MKVEYINHSCLIISVKGKKILTDPWVFGPTWAENLWLFPKAKHKSSYYKDIDLIYISHGHEDHLHKQSIKWLPKSLKKKPVITADFGKGAEYLSEDLNNLGFENIIYLKDKKSFIFNDDVILTVFVNKKDHDSSLLVQHNNTTILHQTDNMFPEKISKYIGQNYNIDMLFTITNRTGPFPGFYILDKHELFRSSKKKFEDSLDISLKIVRNIKPKYVVPNATDICYYNQESFVNKYHKDDKYKYKKLIEKNNLKSKVLIMNPHDSITLNDGDIVENNISKKNIQKSTRKNYLIQKSQVDKIKLIRKKDNINGLELYSNKFLTAINKLNNSWARGKYKVYWIIKNSKKKEFRIFHKVGMEAFQTDLKIHKDYDLLIYIDLFRIKHLFKKRYAMGFMSLWNGGFICKRQRGYSDKERYFWEWVFKINLE